MRYRKITQHKITSLITNSKFAISQYDQIRPCDNYIHVHHQITPINYQVITLHIQYMLTSITIFLQWIDIKRHKATHT
jgi:hypothetical protein